MATQSELQQLKDLNIKQQALITEKARLDERIDTLRVTASTIKTELFERYGVNTMSELREAIFSKQKEDSEKLSQYSQQISSSEQDLATIRNLLKSVSFS